MNERVHRALDGELPREDLTTAERAEAAAFDAAASAIRAQVDGTARRDMDAAVMQRIRDLGLEPLPARSIPIGARLAQSLWSPRELTLRFRPAWGLAAAAVLALAVFAPRLIQGGAADAGSTAVSDNMPAADPLPATTQPNIYVQFRLDAAAARQVALAGSFTGWEPAHALQETSPGVWTIVLPVPAGVHDYVFVVNGEEFIADPAAPSVDDGFGGVNSRLTVLPPSRSL